MQRLLLILAAISAVLCVQVTVRLENDACPSTLFKEMEVCA